MDSSTSASVVNGGNAQVYSHALKNVLCFLPQTIFCLSKSSADDEILIKFLNKIKQKKVTKLKNCGCSNENMSLPKFFSASMLIPM